MNAIDFPIFLDTVIKQEVKLKFRFREIREVPNKGVGFRARDTQTGEVLKSGIAIPVEANQRENE